MLLVSYVLPRTFVGDVENGVPQLLEIEVSPMGYFNSHGSPGIRWMGRKLGNWRKKILTAEPLCRHCARKGLVTRATEVDHIKPLEKGGTYDESNAQPLCHECHVNKTAKDRGYIAPNQFTEDGRIVW